jgi:hypothetical protein
VLHPLKSEVETLRYTNQIRVIISACLPTSAYRLGTLPVGSSGDLQNDGKERKTSHAGGCLEFDLTGRDYGLRTRAPGLRASAAAVIRLVYCLCKQSRSEIYFWGFCFVRREDVLGW